MDITWNHWQTTTLRANTHSDDEADTNTTRRRRQSAVCTHHRDSDGAPLTCGSFQLPQTRLVPRRRLVHPTRELEAEHSDHGRGAHWYYGYGMERERGQGAQGQDARGMETGAETGGWT